MNADGPLAPFVEQAREDLAQRIGVDASAIAVVRAESVTWPDSSLGCPDPKKAYSQVLVDGYDIVLEVQGTQYHYHGGGTQGPFYCATPTS